MSKLNTTYVSSFSSTLNRTFKYSANNQDIKVLAELNMVTPAEIRAVLAESGVEGIEAPKRIDAPAVGLQDQGGQLV